MQPHDPKPGLGPAPPNLPPTPAVPMAGADRVAAQGPPPPEKSLGTAKPQRRVGRFRSRRARLLLALSAGVVALLCLGGVGVIVAVYDNATEIKRTDPSVVLVNFLGAYLTDRDDQEAKLYTCKEDTDLSRLSAFRDEVRKTEGKFSIGVMVSWKNLSVQTSGNHASGSVDIVRTISGGSEETFDPWKFEMSDEDGWRVCSARPDS